MTKPKTPLSLVVKLASIAVHADEFLSAESQLRRELAAELQKVAEAREALRELVSAYERHRVPIRDDGSVFNEKMRRAKEVCSLLGGPLPRTLPAPDYFDRAALETLLRDPEVKAFLDHHYMKPFLPVKQSAR